MATSTEAATAAELKRLTDTVDALHREVQKLRTSEQLSGLFVLDAPIPVRALFGIYGSRTTFSRWKKLGLRLFNVPSMGTSVQPSEFRTFLLRIRGTVTPPEKEEP